MTREFKRADYSVFERTMEQLGVDGYSLCETLGYSKSAWIGWKQDKHTPAVVAVACEALVRRTAQKDVTVLVTVGRDGKSSSRVVNLEELTFAGKKMMVVV